MKATFDWLETKSAIRSGDLALLHCRWALSGTGPDGSPLNLSGTTADVVRRASGGDLAVRDRQPLGYWLRGLAPEQVPV